MTTPETWSYYRARYYESASGRFLSEDPIQFGGGSVDFYLYSSNRSTLFVDPSGLADIQFNINSHRDPGIGGNGLTTFNGAGDPPVVFISCVCSGKGKYRMNVSVAWDINILYGNKAQFDHESQHANIFMGYMYSQKPVYEQLFEVSSFSSQQECEKQKSRITERFRERLMYDLHRANQLERDFENFSSDLMDALTNLFGR
jgi:hypothetical protein